MNARWLTEDELRATLSCGSTVIDLYVLTHGNATKQAAAIAGIDAALGTPALAAAAFNISVTRVNGAYATMLPASFPPPSSPPLSPPTASDNGGLVAGVAVVCLLLLAAICYVGYKERCAPAANSATTSTVTISKGADGAPAGQELKAEKV